MPDLFGFSSFAYVECTTTVLFCLVKSKPVQQEISHTVINPPMVSVLCDSVTAQLADFRLVVCYGLTYIYNVWLSPHTLLTQLNLKFQYF